MTVKTQALIMKKVKNANNYIHFRILKCRENTVFRILKCRKKCRENTVFRILKCRENTVELENVLYSDRHVVKRWI